MLKTRNINEENMFIWNILMPLLNSINQMQDEMKTWRQELHRIPEIGLEEYKTSSYIKEKLKKWVMVGSKVDGQGIFTEFSKIKRYS